VTVCGTNKGLKFVNSTPNSTFVLIIDDDAILLNEMAETFTDNGIGCRVCDNWTSAIELLEDWQPDLIVLDQRLGTTDTLLLMPALRQLTSAPVLFLTGSRSEADRVIGLELGADDFLLKPISGRELVARVRAHLRRVQTPPQPNGGGKWRLINTERKVLRPDGTPVPLTSSEFELLQMVAASPGVAVERETLSRQVLRRAFQAEDRSLDNLVHQIRRKCGRSGAGEVIASVRNVGYVFRGFPDN